MENFTVVFYTVQNALIGHFEALMTYCNVGNPWSQPTLPFNSIRLNDTWRSGLACTAVVHSLEHFSIMQPVTTQIQLCTLIYHLQYEFFQSSFEMPGINNLIDFLSLSHKCSQHLMVWFPPPCNASIFYSCIEKTVSFFLLHHNAPYTTKLQMKIYAVKINTTHGLTLPCKNLALNATVS